MRNLLLVTMLCVSVFTVFAENGSYSGKEISPIVESTVVPPLPNPVIVDRNEPKEPIAKPGDRPPLYDPDPYEPDNSSTQCRWVTIDAIPTTENHTLHTGTDQDWLKFTAVVGRVYTFQSTGTMDNMIYIYQSDGTTLVDSDDDDGDGNNFYLQFAPTTDGDYFVKIVPYASSTGAYVLSYFTSAYPDTFEPDNSAFQYTSIAVTHLHNFQSHTIHSDTDMDWFRLYMSTGSVYHFMSTGETDVRVYLYDDAGSNVLASDDDSGDWLNFYLTHSPTSSGYYKLKVDGLGYSVGTYNIYYWYELPPDIYEPDNTAGTTTSIVPTYAGAYQTRNLHSNTDQDWIAFQGNPGCTYTFFSQSVGDPRIFLYQADGVTLVDSDDDDGDGNNFYLQFAPAVYATYKLKIDGYNGAVGAYDFYYSASSYLDAYEPDNSSSQFTTLSFSSFSNSQNHTLHNDTDQDWYRFYAVGGAGKRYNISSLGSTDTRAYLYHDDGSTLIGSSDNNGSDVNFSMVFAAGTSGWYKLKVSGTNGSLGAYQFRYYVEALPDSYEPDNANTQFTMITPTQSVLTQNHTLSSATDQDWYKFQGVVGKTYTFYSGGLVDTRAYLYQSDGSTQIMFDDNGAGTPNFRLVFMPTYNGLYMIKVNGVGADVGNYTFSYLYSAAADSYEPDNSAGDPTPITVLSTLQTQEHSLHANTDVDWYRFQGLAGRNYHFYSTGGTDTQIYLYADDGTTQLGYNDDSAGYPNFLLNFTPTTTAWYTIKVIGFEGDIGVYGFNYYYGIQLTAPQNIAITKSGTDVTITWNPVAGALSYLIETSSEPYTGFSSVGATSSNFWTTPAGTEPLFFRIKALDVPVP